MAQVFLAHLAGIYLFSRGFLLTPAAGVLAKFASG